MFNRSQFNKTPFNRYELQVFVWTSTAEAVSEASGKFRLVRHGAAMAEAVSEASGRYVRIVFGGALAEAISEAGGRFVRIIFGKGTAEAISQCVSNPLIFYNREQFILTGLNLQAGDELIINTDTMMVYLNGVNVGAKVNDDSIYFKLKPGANKVKIAGGVTDEATIKIDHRGRYL